MRGLLLAAMLGVILTGCPGGALPTFRDARYEPEVIGVIASVTEIEDEIMVELEGGGLVAIREGTWGTPGSRLRQGNLLFYGDRDGSVWYATARPVDETCFKGEDVGMDDGALIRFPSGLRLPKAADFDPGIETDDVYFHVPGFLCIDRNGEVLFFS